MSPRVVWMMAPRGSVAAAAPPSSSTGTSSSAVGFSLKTSLQPTTHDVLSNKLCAAGLPRAFSDRTQRAAKQQRCLGSSSVQQKGA